MRPLLFLLLMTPCCTLRADSPQEKQISPSVIARLIEQSGAGVRHARRSQPRPEPRSANPPERACRALTRPIPRFAVAPPYWFVTSSRPTCRILSPTRLQLTCKEMTPLPEAVEQLARRRAWRFSVAAAARSWRRRRSRPIRRDDFLEGAFEQLRQGWTVETSPRQAEEKQPANRGDGHHRRRYALDRKTC